MRTRTKKTKEKDIFKHICLTAALILTAAVFMGLPGAESRDLSAQDPAISFGTDTFSVFAQTKTASEQAAAGEGTTATRAPLSEEKFAKALPELIPGKCSGTAKGIRLEWQEVPGAEEYEVWRGETKDGKYEEFAVTKELVLKKDADGEYYYKVRAVRGKEKSNWSLTVQISCVSGYAEKMYYDKNGFTRFTIRVSNHTARPIYFYGPGLYNAYWRPHYQIEKIDLESGDKVGRPYPVTASPACAVNRTVCIPAGSDNQKIEIYVPMKLPRLGESGMRDEVDEQKEAEVLGAAKNPEGLISYNDRSVYAEYGNELKNQWFRYRVCMRFYPDMDTPSFELRVTDLEKESKAPARVAR